MPFTQRTSKLEPTDMWMNPCWYSNANEYWDDTNTGHPWGLPNCTCYVWGRLLELGATNLTLCTGNAGSYWEYGDGYQRGQAPRQGALACWYCSGSIGKGHVAIVEEVNGTDIVISDSDYVAIADKTKRENVWDNPHYFSRTTMSPPYNFNGNSGLYTFQGFIYVPIQGGVTPIPRTWHSKNMYLTRSERDDNAVTFYYYMITQGVTYNAILAMLANMESESGINPGIWEGLEPYDGGYGLVQWTPYTKYSQWAGQGWEGNGNKECDRILYEAQNDIQWSSNWYAPNVGYPEIPPITLSDFLHDSVTSPKVLADYWVLYYEHPDESNIPNRIANHQDQVDYYNQLLMNTPISPDPPNPPFYPLKNKVAFMCNKNKFMKRRSLQWRF